MRLAGKHILVTRPAGQSREIVEAIERHGGTALLFPTIEIAPPPSWEECDRRLKGLSLYDGIMFTSANGVDFFFQRLSARGMKNRDLEGKTVFVVGEKTARAVEHHGLAVTLMPDTFTAADLARRLQTEELRGKSYLFPRGNLGGDLLRDNLKLLGATVDSVIVYQTLRPQQERVDEIRALLLNGEVDAASFTSPSTFRNFTALFAKSELAEICRKTVIAVIGPATAKAVRSAGMIPEISSPQQTVESLIEAIASYFASEITS